jgi:hypothetical protein
MNDFEMYSDIDSLAKDFKKDYPELTDYEALSLAVQLQKNQILIAGFNISRTDKYPASLEAIAIQLGYQNKKGKDSNIMDMLNSIDVSISKLQEDK